MRRKNYMIDMIHAMMDDEFHKILENDPVLDALEKEKYNAKDEYFALMQILNPVYMISGIPCSYITPAIWAYMWSIGNAYTQSGGKEITENDTDMMMYVLHHGITSIDDDYVLKSARFCELHGISYIEARLDILQMIYIAFRPLEMIPSSGSGDNPMYDADWLTKVVSVACQMTNRASNDIMYNMSLTECYYYYIQYMRRNDYNNEYKRRNSAEIVKASWDRTMELGREYWEKNYKDKD